MKKILYTLLTGAMMALTGCSNENTEVITPNATPTVFTLSAEQTRTMVTIAPTRYVIEVYNEDGTTPENVFENGTNHAETTTGNSFTVTFDREKAYTCLFWADDATAVGTTSATYNANSLKAIGLNSGKTATEAYFSKVKVDKGRTPAVTVTLKRAVAKITLTETDGVESDKKLTVAYKQYTSFNALNGQAAGRLTDASYTTLTSTGTTPYKLATFYVLGKTDKELVDFSFTYASESSKPVTNVPLRINYHTNINGGYSSLATNTFHITADDQWNGGSNIVLGSVDYTTKPLSNCYIINSDPKQNRTYLIPVRRVNDFWGQSTYSTESQTANQIGTNDTWTIALLWQDVNGMVTKADKTTITLGKTTGIGPDDFFTIIVPKNYCATTQGNFVIALAKGTVAPTTNGATAGPSTGDGAILWSWHFWVTDYNPYPEVNPEITNPETHVYPLADGTGELHRLKNGSNGYGDKTAWTKEYLKRFMLDRNIGATSTVYSAQAGILHYQFGRKDPFPAATALYDILGAPVVYSNNANKVSGAQSMTYAVNNPLQFISISRNNWCNTTQLNNNNYYWNDPNVLITNTDKKSIFDPSPLGFKAPRAGTWSAFSTSTFKYSSTTKSAVYNGIIYPSSGSRYDSDGTLYQVGSRGYYWSGYPDAAKDGEGLYFNSSSVKPSEAYSKALGWCIRAVQE